MVYPSGRLHGWPPPGVKPGAAGDRFVDRRCVLQLKIARAIELHVDDGVSRRSTGDFAEDVHHPLEVLVVDRLVGDCLYELSEAAELHELSLVALHIEFFEVVDGRALAARQANFYPERFDFAWLVQDRCPRASQCGRQGLGNRLGRNAREGSLRFVGFKNPADLVGLGA